jgi:hypothetical protein
MSNGKTQPLHRLATDPTTKTGHKGIKTEKNEKDYKQRGCHRTHTHFVTIDGSPQESDFTHHNFQAYFIISLQCGKAGGEHHSAV